MNLNSMLRDMGLVDAFSTSLSQVEIEQDPRECNYSCRGGCSESCNEGCIGGCKASNKGDGAN